MRAAVVCLASLLAGCAGKPPGHPHALLSIRSNERCNEHVFRSRFHDPEMNPPMAEGANFTASLDEAGDAWAAENCDIAAREEAVPFTAHPHSGWRPGAAGAPTGYTHPDDMMKAYEALASAHPSIAKMIDITAELGAPTTHEGRHIWAMKVSDNVEEDEDEPNVLLIHNVHARELISPQVGLDNAERLVRGYARRDRRVRSIVDSQQIYIIVSANPDGWYYCWTDNNMWRKNRRNNGGSHGVDMNRNFPFGWQGYSCSGSTTERSETYRGPSAASEPEVQTLIMLIEALNPAKILDYHSYARDVRVNYAQPPPNGIPSLPTSLDELGIAAAKKVAEGMDYIQVRSGACGTEASHSTNTHGTLAFLVETGRAFQPPADEMRSELVRVWPGTEWFLHNPIPVMGHVINADKRGIAAEITLPDIDFRYGERMRASPGTGRFSLWVPAGTHRITASAPGYADETVTVEVKDGASSSVSIELGRQRNANETIIV